MDITQASEVHRSLELFHAFTYFSPEVQLAYTQLGATRPLQGYFASRVAPMGAVVPEVVYSSFYTFPLSQVMAEFAGAWDVASPGQWIHTRYSAVSDIAHNIFNDIDPIIFERLATELYAVVNNISDYGGRNLAAGYSNLPWPEDPIMRAWHGQTILREFRGDGHIIALISAGLSGLEAYILNTASGRRFSYAYARSRRFSPEEWDEMEERLCAKKLLSAPGVLSESGIKLVHEIEHQTDILGFAPWKNVSDSSADTIVDAGTRVISTLIKSGRVPKGVFTFLP